MDKINLIIDQQKEFQRVVGIPIDSQREGDRNEMGEKFLFKAIEEIIELRKEFPSVVNPWSKKQHLADYTRIREEFSDVILFLLNFAIVWKIDILSLLDDIANVQANNFKNVKLQKMNQLNKEILNVPGYVSGVGQGNINPSYIFVGMNPGADIDHGYKFWSDSLDGSSMVLLPALEKIGLTKHCYFTNIVKSVTVGNTEPSDEVLNFWSHYFIQEVGILTINNPNIKIIAMGKYVSNALSKIEFPHVYKTSSINHPASVQYGGITQEEYENQIRSII